MKWLYDRPAAGAKPACLTVVFLALLAVPGRSEVGGFELGDIFADDFTLFGSRLLESRVYTDNAETIDGTTLTDTSGTFLTTLSSGDPYFVEIYTGLSAGKVVQLSAIVSDTVLTLSEALPLETDVSFGIRPIQKLSDLINPVDVPELNQVEGFDPDTGDLIFLANAEGRFDRFFYSSETGSTGFFNATTGAPEDPLVIYPEGLIYLRRGNGFTLVTVGSVKEEDTLVTLDRELNFVCPVNPAATLDTLGLSLSLLQGEAETADLVGLQDSFGNFIRYFYSDGSGTGLTTGWRLVDPPVGQENVDQGATMIPSGMTVELLGSGPRNVLLSAPDLSP